MTKSDDNQKSHYYWVIPIVLFIITQSSLAIWWASALSQNMDSYQGQLTKFMDDSETEDLRQWSRINANEDRIGTINTAIATTNTQLGAITSNIDRLESALQENNSLLRELLGKQ